MNRLRVRALLALCIAPLLLAFSCNEETTLPADETVRWFVAPEKIACQGMVPMMCLQVKERMEDPWLLFHREIEGFAYEPGYLYEIVVHLRHIANPPADGSSVEYTLVQLVSKTGVPAAQ
jgi:hypothetical protein